MFTFVQDIRNRTRWELKGIICYSNVIYNYLIIHTHTHTHTKSLDKYI